MGTVDRVRACAPVKDVDVDDRALYDTGLDLGLVL